MKAAPWPHLCHNRGFYSFLGVSATSLLFFFVVLPYNYSGQDNTRHASFCFCVQAWLQGNTDPLTLFFSDVEVSWQSSISGLVAQET